MISVQEIIQDPDLAAPAPFVILRSTGYWVNGGFESVTTQIPQFGPVQQATPKEIAMLPEADRVGSVRSFWTTIQVHTTTATDPIPVTHGEVPQGAVPGSVYTLSTEPPNGVVQFYINGSQQDAAQFFVSGATLTTAQPTAAGDVLYVTWPLTQYEQVAASDIIQYGQEQYRILSVYRVFGSGYWKALGHRLNAA